MDSPAGDDIMDSPHSANLHSASKGDEGLGGKIYLDNFLDILIPDSLNNLASFSSIEPIYDHRSVVEEAIDEMDEYEKILVKSCVGAVSEFASTRYVFASIDFLHHLKLSFAKRARVLDKEYLACDLHFPMLLGFFKKKFLLSSDPVDTLRKSSSNWTMKKKYDEYHMLSLPQRFDVAFYVYTSCRAKLTVQPDPHPVEFNEKCRLEFIQHIRHEAWDFALEKKRDWMNSVSVDKLASGIIYQVDKHLSGLKRKDRRDKKLMSKILKQHERETKKKEKEEAQQKNKEQKAQQKERKQKERERKKMEVEEEKKKKKKRAAAAQEEEHDAAAAAQEEEHDAAAAQEEEEQNAAAGTPSPGP